LEFGRKISIEIKFFKTQKNKITEEKKLDENKTHKNQ
jgi:hypothetical protein